MDSQAGLVVQWAGITLIVVLSFFVRRSAKRTSVAYWACGWLCLAIALGSLELAFRSPHFRRILTAVYFFGEYSFGYLFISGCRNWATGAVLNRRSWSLAGAGAATAVGLTFVSGNFDIEFIPHAAIVAGLFGSAFFALHRARLGRETGLGLRVMSIALLLLTLDFLHYVPVFGYAVLFHVQPPFGYLRYTSIYDLILEILLGFGTVMLVMEAAQEEIAAANRELTAARDRLEVLARRDPLTEALNRHAFYSLMASGGKPGDVEWGSAVVIDIDNLKPINDSIGHSAGDEVIRVVATAIRSAIRPDDLLFRWGGDEFLALMFGFKDTDVRARIETLNERLNSRPDQHGGGAPAVSISFGIASFGAVSEIEHAIDRADIQMYQTKQSRKQSGRLSQTMTRGGD